MNYYNKYLKYKKKYLILKNQYGNASLDENKNKLVEIIALIEKLKTKLNNSPKNESHNIFLDILNLCIKLLEKDITQDHIDISIINGTLMTIKEPLNKVNKLPGHPKLEEIKNIIQKIEELEIINKK
jgi:hypothetical protein